MKVFVNDKEVHLAPGMTVRHAIIGAGLGKEIKTGKRILDEWGNEVGLDGAVFEDYRIYLSDSEK